MPWHLRVKLSCVLMKEMPIWEFLSLNCRLQAFGIEKIVPDRKSLSIFTRLIARSATGQPITTYTSHYRKPRAGGEFHIILVDNGRSKILADQNHIKALNCIRCGACMNTCPVYRRSGGYSYTYFIPWTYRCQFGNVERSVAVFR